MCCAHIRRCLYGEMKVRDAILKGTTEAEQLELIYRLFGTPTGTAWDRIEGEMPLYCTYSFTWLAIAIAIACTLLNLPIFLPIHPVPGEVEEMFSKLPESASEKMQFRTVYMNRVRKDPRFSRYCRSHETPWGCISLHVIRYREL